MMAKDSHQWSLIFKMNAAIKALLTVQCLTITGIAFILAVAVLTADCDTKAMAHVQNITPTSISLGECNVKVDFMVQNANETATLQTKCPQGVISPPAFLEICYKHKTPGTIHLLHDAAYSSRGRIRTAGLVALTLVLLVGVELLAGWVWHKLSHQVPPLSSVSPPV